MTKPPERPLSISEISQRIAEAIASQIAPCWLRGEISNLRLQSSGHTYFSLKDENAQIGAVLFRGAAGQLQAPLREGMQVLAFGEINLYAPQGKYQIVVRKILEDGAGRLQQQFERLKRQLAAEGLFAPERKKQLPKLPQRIGFITSPSGAALQDFIRILERRDWRGHLVLLPARVQGAEAAAEMRDMLALSQQLTLGPNGEPVLTEKNPAPAELFFELLVIGRGGGSAEDLAVFNDEALVRSIAACTLPIISAVGHEIDFTLSDFAADVRAETPSAAAEIISSSQLRCREMIAAFGENLETLASDKLHAARQSLDAARDRLRLLTPNQAIERASLRLDDLSNRFDSLTKENLQKHSRRLETVGNRVAHASPEVRIRFESQRLLGLWKRLQSASPNSVLKRGFAIVRDASGAPIMRSENIKSGQPLSLQFSDGTAAVSAEKKPQ